jgi:hypothetical protein
MTLPDGYYAVPDPDNAATMTYWRVKDGARYRWPAKARYGPVPPPRKDAPGVKGSPEWIAWAKEYGDRRWAWNVRVDAALTAAPATAAKRFAELTTKCCCCGRGLTDARSKVLGIGPDCRSRVDPGGVAALVLTPQIAKAHAATLLTHTADDIDPS